MTRACRPAALVFAAVAWAGTGYAAAAPPTSYALRGAAGLARVYDTILDARFDQVEAELRRACGPAPAEACEVLAATALWWQILLDPSSLARDAEFSAAVTRAIDHCEAWTVRTPDDPEAWFYLGGAYAARVQWRVLREEKLAAARDGKHIRQALDRAIKLAPDLDDAYFAIGMYKYYADVAPASAKILRFLLLLPGGDRHAGLAEMLRARDRGRILQGEADYQLHLIYLWYEQQAGTAVGLLEKLHDRYPGNPLFLSALAEIQDAYQHDITLSLGTWQRLLEAAREARVNGAAAAEVQARLGIARELDALAQTDRAADELAAVVALAPDTPYSSLALASLRLGEAHDRLGRREPAVAAYRAAIAAAPSGDPFNVRAAAGERIRRAPDARHAEAYRLSLEGWRHFERNGLGAASAALERSLALNPADPVARFRYGRVLEARHDDVAALGQFELAIRAGRGAPAPILGTTYLEAARLNERAGQTAQAVSYYRIASTLFGAAAETHRTAARALARIGERLP